MPKHTLYFSAHLFESLDVDTRPTGSEGLSNRVGSLCAIALETMREAVPPLLSAEWEALLDISNEHSRRVDRSVAEQAHSFRIAVSLSGPDRNERWGMNCAELARKLGQLRLIEQCAVMEVCRRYWTRRDISKRFDNFRDMMEAHGARFSD